MDRDVILNPEPVTYDLRDLFFSHRAEECATIERAKAVLSLTKNTEKCFSSKKTLGFHGTAAASIFRLVRDGSLPIREEDNVTSLKDRIFFMPKKNTNFSAATIEFWGISLDNPRKEAETYASIAAKRQLFLNKSNLPFCSEEGDEFYFPDEVQTTAVKDMLDRLRTLAPYRKGFLLGISESAVRDFKYEFGDHEYDVAIKCPEGLPLSYITAIQPLGYWEASWLKKLEKLLKK